MRALAAGVCLWLAAATPALADLDRDGLRELENLLARLGFDPGPVDGVADPRTATAIEGYQTFAALPVNGRASEALLAELRGVAATLSEIRGTASAAPAAPRSESPEAGASQTETGKTEKLEVAVLETSTGDLEIALHLASLRTEDGARREWTRLQNRLPDLLGDMALTVAAVDLGDRGVFYRVLTGPFPNHATAADLCAQIGVEGQECRVIQGPPPEVAEVAAAPEKPAAPSQPQEPAAAAPGTVETPTATQQAAAPPRNEPAASRPQEPAISSAPKATDSPPVSQGTAAAAPSQPNSASAPGETPQTAALPGDGFAAYQRANEAFERTDCGRAIMLYSKALERGGLTNRDLITSYNNRGRCFFLRGQYDEAIADHAAAIDLGPNFAAAFFNRGRAHQAKGEHERAQEDLQRAYDLGFRRLGPSPSMKP